MASPGVDAYLAFEATGYVHLKKSSFHWRVRKLFNFCHADAPLLRRGQPVSQALQYRAPIQHSSCPLTTTHSGVTKVEQRMPLASNT
ncbi:hypothetical protein T265_15808, partial [Opisthorchis viverrini]